MVEVRELIAEMNVGHDGKKLRNFYMSYSPGCVVHT
jgi:hypothetical protein